jgi:hypothetical protein
MRTFPNAKYWCWRHYFSLYVGLAYHPDPGSCSPVTYYSCIDNRMLLAYT